MLIILFIIGLAFGSFASVIIHRLHKNEGGIVFGRSHCPQCDHPLGPRDLVPLLSYLWNGAKCRHCKTGIGWMYPLIELCMGLMFALAGYFVGFDSWVKLAFYLVTMFVFTLLVFYDILFQEVPDEVSLPAIGLALLFAGFYPLHDWVSLGLGTAVPVLFFGILSFASGGRWLGGGDIRIGALMGLLLGWPMILVGLFLGYLSGSVYSVFGLAFGKLHRGSLIPFAPFLLFGATVALYWGEPLLNWYLRML